tara:strand:- start:145 stop:1389 length:1245 start_codon:yes stop_codon:yes gene_type:complete
MLSNIPGNKEFVDYFFKNHRLFFCDSLPWQFYNYENALSPRTTSLNVRLLYLFSKQGFFNRMELEKNNKNIFNEFSDYSDNFKNKRYIVQENISNNFHNPTHHSFKANDKSKKISIDFNNPRSALQKFCIITHPGNTRFFSSVYLQKNLGKAFVYVHKDNYYDEMFTQNMKEIKSTNELLSYWKPRNSSATNLSYEFILSTAEPTLDVERQMFMRSKYHISTDCSVFKLWRLVDIDTIGVSGSVSGVDKLHTSRYMNYVNESGKELADIIFEKKLTIYTNSSIDVKNYFLNIRKELINKAKFTSDKSSHQYSKFDYFFNKMDNFDFDVVMVDEKPTNMSELNGNKGFAIWIDKDMVEKTNREIFEFLCFTRRDVKLAETKDGKISVVNCRDIDSDIKWEIHNEFLKCEVSLNER